MSNEEREEYLKDLEEAARLMLLLGDVKREELADGSVKFCSDVHGLGGEAVKVNIQNGYDYRLIDLALVVMGRWVEHREKERLNNVRPKL